MEKEQIDALAAELGTTPEKAEELLEQANHFWDNKKREQQMLEEMEAIPYHLYNPIPPPINFHPRISSTKFTNPNKAKVKKKNKAQRASRRRNRK